MKAKRVILLGAVFVLFMVNIAPAATITVKVGNGKGQPEKSAELPITVSSLKGLEIIAMDLSLEYDASVLSFSALNTEGTIIKDWSTPIYHSTPGILTIAMYSTKAIEGKGKLLKIIFNVNAQAKAGKTQVMLRQIIFNDGKIPVVLKKGTIKIAPLRRKLNRR